jgi:hypothetical protein
MRSNRARKNRKICAGTKPSEDKCLQVLYRPCVEHLFGEKTIGEKGAQMEFRPAAKARRRSSRACETVSFFTITHNMALSGASSQGVAFNFL